MSTKIAFIGAGSTVFAKNLMGDILSFPELQDSTLALYDINEERLNTSEIVAKQIAKQLGANPTIEATTDRRCALDGASYVITMFQIGGYKPSTVIDFEIPKKYGLRQTIADTLGIGGIMRGLRTIPVLLDLCRDMEELCPDATLLQYVNPMVMNCWAISRATKIKTVGLCHSVQGTASQLARDIGIPLDEINYVCAGINHMAFYLKFEHKTPNGTEDLYPRIRQVLEEGRAPEGNLVRYEMLKRLGYFVTESSEHFAEYVPWFIKRDRPDLIEEFNIPLDEYIRRCEVQITGWQFMKQKLENPRADLSEEFAKAMQKAGVPEKQLPRVVRNFENLNEVKRSHEYGSGIIHSMETGELRVIYGNVPNHNLIENLPAGCSVEVPCLVDKNGVQPVAIGQLPPHLAALMQTNLNVQSLTVEAALTGKRDHIYHAAMLDPHTAAELSLDQIWNLVDDLIEAHGEMLPAYH
ncbi:MAG: alpha-glucosidase/alpha-galactosidase [Caldilineaceae bacterium]